MSDELKIGHSPSRASAPRHPSREARRERPPPPYPPAVDFLRRIARLQLRTERRVRQRATVSRKASLMGSPGLDVLSGTHYEPTRIGPFARPIRCSVTTHTHPLFLAQMIGDLAVDWSAMSPIAFRQVPFIGCRDNHTHRHTLLQST